MLATLLVWAVTLAVALAAGSLVARALGVTGEGPSGRLRFIFPAWLGLLSLAWLFLLVALITPLAPPVTGGLALTVTLASLLWRSSRGLLGAAVRELGRAELVGLSALALICAIYASQVVFLGDTGGYHFTLVRWLAEYGTVPGLAWLHDRFGFSSAWFALTAAWNHGPLAGRSGALLGGFALWLMLAHAALALTRLRRGPEDHAAWFAVAGYGLLFPLLWRWSGAISPSPDVPVMMLGVVAGTWLLAPGLSTRARYVGLFVLAAFAANLKLSVLPILAVAWWLLVRVLGGWQRIGVTLAAGVALFPLLATNTMTTGYPLYPSTFARLDVPWALDPEQCSRTAQIIRDFAWYGIERWDQPDRHAPFLTALAQWATSRLEWPTALLLVASLAAGLHLYFRRALGTRDVNGVAALALLGIAFFMTTAPTLRFGIQWLVLLPALWLAILQPGWLKRLLLALAGWPYTLLVTLALAAAIWLSPSQMQRMLYAAIDRGEIPLAGHARLNFGLTPEMLNLATEYDATRRVSAVRTVSPERRRGHGFDYYSNGHGYCWNLPLPCGDASRVALLRPEKGIGGGFLPLEQK